jgi:hypothetical protein
MTAPTPAVEAFMQELGFQRRGSIGQEYYGKVNGEYRVINSEAAAFFHAA